MENKTKKVITYRQLKQDTEELARKITKNYSSVFGIPSGGILPAFIVSNWLKIPLVEKPVKETLIVDDLIDSGKTLKKYSNYDTAVIYYKSHSPKTTYRLKKVSDWISLPHEALQKGVENNITRMIEFIGENPLRTGLKDTPDRIVRFYKEKFSGYKDCNLKLTVFPNNDDGITYDQIIIDKGYFYSFCEHHLVPFFGDYAIGYIPSKKIIGLSKIAQIVDYYSNRLQVQERMTEQVANKLEEILQPKGVIVILKARHLCREMRDVKKNKAEMITSAIKGTFRSNPTAKQEFLNLIKL